MDFGRVGPLIFALFFMIGGFITVKNARRDAEDTERTKPLGWRFVSGVDGIQRQRFAGIVSILFGLAFLVFAASRFMPDAPPGPQAPERGAATTPTVPARARRAS